MSPKGTPEIKICFDTSVLFSGTASDLLSTNILELIKSYSNIPDFKVLWYLPDVVVKEREFQMLKEAKRLLPSIEKLEKLLGHNLNITEEIVHDGVKKGINNEIQDYSINVINLNIANIPWQKIIEKSVHRIPPFEDGDKEKGFRDELIQQAFFQLITDSPKTPAICRVIFLGRDKLLLSSLVNETNGINNVKIFSGIEDLKSFINTLTSEVQEGLIDSLLENAGKLFFEKDNQDSLYYRANVFREIEEKFKPRLEELAPGSDSRMNGTRYITKPRFFSKKGQRITWKTRIDVASKAFKTVMETVKASPSSSPLAQVLAEESKPMWMDTLLGNTYKQELVANGRTTFEITWSVTLTTRRKLSNPKVEAVNFIEINWNEKIEE